MPIESGDSSNCQLTRDSFKQARASLLQVSANGFDSLQRSDMKAGMSRIVETGYGSAITDAFGEITMKHSERSSAADIHSGNGSDTDAGKINHESQASVIQLQNSSSTRIVRIIGKLVTWGRVTSPRIWITSTGSTSTSTSTRSSSISSTAGTMTSTSHSEEGQKTLGDHDSDLIDDDDSTSKTSISRSNISSSSSSTTTTTMSYYLDEGKKVRDDHDRDDGALKDMHSSTSNASATITSANNSSSSSSSSSTGSSKNHSDEGKKTEDDDNKDLIDDSSRERMNSKGEDFETTANNVTSITRYNKSKGTSDEDYITDNSDSLQGVAISSTGASTSWNTRTSTTSFTTTSTSMSRNANTASTTTSGTLIADKPSTTNTTTITTSVLHHVSTSQSNSASSTAASSTVMVGTSIASTTSPATTGTSMGDSVSTSQRGSDSSTASLDVGMKFGGEVDSHGCDGSAGYIWCEAKRKCMRSWEQDCPNNVKIDSSSQPDHLERASTSASTTAMTTSTRTSIASTTIISPSDVDDNSQPEQSTGIGIGTTTMATSTISSIASTTMNSKTEIIATVTSTTTLRTTWAEDVLENIEPLDQKDERAGKAKQILARAREMRLRWQQR